jgi:threonine/homoserine/homoserine lactone efflux protein
MYLAIPTWLVFLFLCVASFAPVASQWPGWWVPYYGALLVCWVVVSIVAVRRMARDERRARRRRARMMRQLQWAAGLEAAEERASDAADVVAHPATDQATFAIRQQPS